MHSVQTFGHYAVIPRHCLAHSLQHLLEA